MISEIETAIKALVEKAATVKPVEALQLTQAALNLAHVAATFDGISRQGK